MCALCIISPGLPLLVAQGTDVRPGACRDSCSVCPYPKITDGTTKAPQPRVMTEKIVRSSDPDV